MSSFEQIEILNNFYQTSSFFPMPTVLVSTLSPDGMTNLGAYSLCFPYYIAEKDYYGMFLGARNSSNTAKNILRDKKCAINFLEDKTKYIKEIVRLGFPGDETDKKMQNTIFTLEDSERADDDPENNFPKIVREAVQVFECTWDDSEAKPVKNDGAEYVGTFNRYNGITSPNGAIFILKIDKILLKPEWKKAIVQGSGRMPSLPVDYGFRNNTDFWIAKGRRPQKHPIPRDKGVGEEVVQAAAEKMDPSVTWDTACFTRLKLIPKVFLNLALKGIISEAKEQGITH